MPEYKNVMVSSTARDLPEHRKQMMDAILRMSMFPLMMEHLPPLDADAIKASLDMVDRADIYIGIFAHRYGYVPKDGNPQHISVTEMEYRRAVERKIPRLIFFVHKEHLILADDMGEDTTDPVETAKRKVKLAELKNEIGTSLVAGFYKSPEDLRALAVQALSEYRQTAATPEYHHVTTLTEPPTPYIAHPYTLLQTGSLIGRHDELNLLTDWVSKPSADIYRARMLNVVAVGGMGKSALTWHWFNQVAPLELKPLAGRFWWSFYESDARFENFVIRALAYVSRQPIETVETTYKRDPASCESQLIAILDREPFLLMLDGLERVLNAYARLDAAHLSDDDLDIQTANRVAGAIGLPASAGESFLGQHLLRKTADPRVGVFLRRLANVRATRTLISTRLYPADLQTITGNPIAGCFALFLPGLSDDDATGLWRAMGVSGTREELLQLFHTFDNYPLLIQALAGEVARYRRASGDFDAWRKANPDFNPFRKLSLVQTKSHVLEYALKGLDENARRILSTIAAFRAPTDYDTLCALFVGSATVAPETQSPIFDTEAKLDAALQELEDRGLVGWDKRANRYDLHPIVRGVAWAQVDEGGKQGVYSRLYDHFKSIPAIDEDDVNSLEDLAPTIELYNTLIGLGRYDEANDLFYERLNKATLHRLSSSRQRIELLEKLFPDGLDALPRQKKASDQAFVLNALATGYVSNGQPGRAAPLFRRQIALREQEGNQKSISIGLGNLSNALRLSGQLRAAEGVARRALGITRERKDAFQESVSLYYIGLAQAARQSNVVDRAQNGLAALERSLRIWLDQHDRQGEGMLNAYLAQAALWRGDPAAAQRYADRAWEIASSRRNERDFIQSARLQGAAALALGDLTRADERLHLALTRARTVNYVEEELPALTGLAELSRRRGDPAHARELLGQIWESAERGPYPLDHADALNVLAQLERDAGNQAAAVDAATRAYQKAWCDGPPFAYYRGLEDAKAHLIALGVPFPDMPPFDPSKFEPMPDVEIDPPDAS